jgi:hypothetical protein
LRTGHGWIITAFALTLIGLFAALSAIVALNAFHHADKLGLTIAANWSLACISILLAVVMRSALAGLLAAQILQAAVMGLGSLLIRFAASLWPKLTITTGVAHLLRDLVMSSLVWACAGAILLFAGPIWAELSGALDEIAELSDKPAPVYAYMIGQGAFLTAYVLLHTSLTWIILGALTVAAVATVVVLVFAANETD